MFSHQDFNLHFPDCKQGGASFDICNPRPVNCSSVSLASFSAALLIFFSLIYRSSTCNLDATPMSVIHQGPVVSFNLQEREEGLFCEL